MAGPGVYERRRAKKERQRLAEKLADLPWEVDPYTGRVTGMLPGEKSTTRTPEDVERWLRSAGRTSPSVPRATTAPSTPTWLRDPWQTLQSPAQPGEYARWSQPAYPSLQQWYAPQAQVESRPEAVILNRLLPYLSSEDDIQAMARYLYTIGGGETGPFANYLSATATPGASAPTPPAGTVSTYDDVLNAIGGIFANIPDQTAKNWVQSVFDVYRDFTQPTGMRSSEQEATFQAQLGELFSSIPDEAQPYAAMIQRIVVPTIRRPELEWYELPAGQRTSPSNLRTALNLTSNPMWW